MTAPLPAVLKGVAFEHRSLAILRQHLSMSLTRVGGKGDGGIDLQGWWWLPSKCLCPSPSSSSSRPQEAEARSPVRVYAQCKAEERKIGPRYIREFEGAVLRYSSYLAADAPREPLVGLFASTSPFSTASLLLAFSSPTPLALLHLPERRDPALHSPTPTNPGDTADTSGSVVFNPALSAATGLLRGTVEARWERSSQAAHDWRPGIWHDGRRIESWVPADHALQSR